MQQTTSPTSHVAIASGLVGDYALNRKLGSGAMGEVWLAHHRVSHAPAAVKLVGEPRWLKGRMRRLVESEQRAISRLSHPNIVALYDHGPNYLVMQYVDGPNLSHRLRTPVEPADGLDWGLQIASALSHAHERGVVHRDVKPGNVLLDGGGSAYLGDFGLAIVVDDGEEVWRGGTPGYMAPEQHLERRVGPAADQYGLARTLLELLTGASSPADEGAAIAMLSGAFPDDLRDALHRALARDPEQRFASMTDFAAALSEVDLQGQAAPKRLAPERRVRAPFAWCATPAVVEAVAPDIHRADYRLSSLEQQGHLPAGAATRFREATGYGDFGWALYAHTTRLGPMAQASLMTRVTDIVVLCHGSLCDRSVWGAVAATICRQNAQTAVLVPDLLGFGESPFAAEAHDLKYYRPRALVDALLAWLELLSLGDIPTVIAAHSVSAASLLSVKDADLGEQISRVAITPIFPEHYGPIRRSLKVGAAMMRTVGRFGVTKRALGKLVFLHGSATRAYRPEERRDMYEKFLSVDVATLSRIYRGIASAKLALRDDLQRCAVVVGKDDPVAPAEHVMKTLGDVGLPKHRIHQLASGGHLPQGGDEQNPGWTMRNAHDIARIIESMLLSSRQGAPDPTAMESTMLNTGPATPTPASDTTLRSSDE